MSNAAVLPQITDEVLASLAQAEGVCIRPLLNKVTDTATGETHLVPIRCGSTREAVCPPCAQRNRRLRMQQCREGWHLDTEPESEADAQANSANDDDRDLGNDDGDLGEVARRVRSTRRRQDAPDLPRLPVESRTIGKVFEAPDGRRFRPSMFATFTLPSYGRVRPDGTPVDPDRYDYRRAALDAMHFPKLVDRLWQNLRRATGYRVQYFAAVEPQRRLAPHLHAAIRGAIPRQVFRQVVAATYHQVWWPRFDRPVFTEDRMPVWSTEVEGYVDLATGEPLPTWGEGLDRLDAELETDPGLPPTHVVRFGTQLDLQG
ncbi:MAG: replication initiation protein, partial [Propionibacteriales bacterium]|nr:replication initiation protein [Propionibacteriales bacterium]